MEGRFWKLGSKLTVVFILSCTLESPEEFFKIPNLEPTPEDCDVIILGTA